MQKSRCRRRLEFGVLPLTAAGLAACLQLQPATAPPTSDRARMPAATSTAALPAAASGRGLPAYLLAPGEAFALQAPARRSLPELREPQGTSSSDSSNASASAADPAERSADAEVDPEATGDQSRDDAFEHAEVGVPLGFAELPRGTVVLHVGDSFAGALGVPLGKRLKAAGLRSVLQFKKASYIPTWAFGDELRINIDRHQPDLVLVSLGANEIELRVPKLRVYAIKRLVATVGERPCVWISPPSWKPDAGLLAVIRDNISPCRYLDSDALVPYLPRGPDSIHPSLRGREMWADAVFDWLSRERDPRGQQPWQLRAGEPAGPTAEFQGGFPARRAAQR